MASPAYVVYVDESGDEGFRFERGSSHWFILSAVITRKAEDLATVKLVDTVRGLLNKPPKKPLHFRDLKHEQRIPFVEVISQASLKVVNVLVHKPTIKEQETFQHPHRLYYYMVRYLLERVSWYCREHRRSPDLTDGSAEIVFSNRSGMPYQDMREYLDRLEKRSKIDVNPAVHPDWSVIKTDQIRSFSAGKRMGLQIADAVASSCYYAVEPSQYGYNESRYIVTLKPRIYQRKGRYIGNGLKFWPREVVDSVHKDEGFRWAREHFT